MRIIKFSLIFLCLFIYLIIGLAVRIFFIFANRYTTTIVLNKMTYYLMRMFALIGGLKVRVSGNKDILKKKGIFIVSPHVGYIDAIVLGTILPGSFTTKNEVKKIPFLGQVVAIGDSIFIDRHRKNDIIEYVNVMAERLKHKINIFNFPEGHATDGKRILPFFASFFNAPLMAKSPILPVTIDYEKVNGSSDFDRDEVYCYEGKISIIKHLWNLLTLKSIEVTVTLHETIYPNGHVANAKNRTLMSNLCLNRLSTYQNLPISDEHPFQRSSSIKSNS